VTNMAHRNQMAHNTNTQTAGQSSAGQQNVYVTDQNVLYKLNSKGGSVLWKHSYDARKVPSSLQAVDGAIYGYIGSDFCALNNSNGNILWQRSLAGSTVIKIAGGLIYLVDNHSGTLSALNAKDGSQKWSNTTVDMRDRLGDNGSWSSVSNGTFYTKTISQGIVYAFDTTTGAERWHYTKPGGQALSLPNGSVPSGDGVVYSVSAVGDLYALNAKDGQLLWQKQAPNGESFLSEPQVGDGVIYATSVFRNGDGSEGYMYAFSAHNGKQLWRSPKGLDVGYGVTGKRLPPVTNGRIIFPGLPPGKTNSLYALNAKDGTISWKSSLSCKSCDSYLEIRDGKVYSEELSNQIGVPLGVPQMGMEVFDLQTGKQLSQHACSEQSR